VVSIPSHETKSTFKSPTSTIDFSTANHLLHNKAQTTVNMQHKCIPFLLLHVSANFQAIIRPRHKHRKRISICYLDRIILLYIGKVHYKYKNVYKKYVYKLTGVLNYGMLIKIFVGNPAESVKKLDPG
jgi:hypothetical protein